MNPDQALLAAWRDGDDGDAGTNPLARQLAMRIVRLDRAGHRVRLRFTPVQSLRTPEGALTTTAIASMLDFACGYVAIAALVPSHTVASSTLHLDWIVDSDAADLEANASIAGRNATTVFTRATLFDGAGRAVALANSTLRILATNA